MTVIDYNINTYDYFKWYHPFIDQGLVLDYGSNYGMFLESSSDNFPQKNYTGVDVSSDAIAQGRIRFPEAEFILSNHYNIIYNPKGSYKRPVITKQFDCIISYSVLTHTTLEDKLETIDWLYTLLRPRGRMLLSFLDVEDDLTRTYFFRKRYQQYGSCDPIFTDSFNYLCDNKLTKQPQSCSHLLLFFQQNFLSSRIKYKHKLHAAPSGQISCFQSCLEIIK